MNTYERQAVQTINQFVEDANGNWAEAKHALDVWCVEVMALGKIECMDGWRCFLLALDSAWLAMEPVLPAASQQPAHTSSDESDDD